MRLVFYAVLCLGAAVIAMAILSWAAQRRLEALAAPLVFDDPARLPEVDVALVLGTAPIGPEGGPNRYLQRRLDAAAALWQAKKVKYLLASGDRRGADYDEPAAMRAGLIARGVPAEAIYCDFAGVRTHDSVVRANDVYGQKRLIVVSQKFHVARALFLARAEGIEAWGLAARDIGRPYNVLTTLRRYPSALRAYYDVWFDTPPRHVSKPVVIGVDPPG